MENKVMVGLVLAMAVLLVILAAWYFLVLNRKEVLLGGDRDAHGCIGSAGYSWCEVKNKCLRVWEEKCE